MDPAEWAALDALRPKPDRVTMAITPVTAEGIDLQHQPLERIARSLENLEKMLHYFLYDRNTGRGPR
jgi:hypothetical protein